MALYIISDDGMYSFPITETTSFNIRVSSPNVHLRSAHGDIYSIDMLVQHFGTQISIYSGDNKDKAITALRRIVEAIADPEGPDVIHVRNLVT